MELQILSFPFILSFFIFAFMVLKIGNKQKNGSKLNFPPGPWKLPLIGNLHNLITSLPHRKLRDLSRKYGPLMHLKLGEVSTIVVSSAEIAKEIMKTHDINFSSRTHTIASKTVSYGCLDVVFSPYGEYWRELRKICTLELFSAKRVQSFRSIREDEVSNMIQSISLSVGSPINLSEKIFSTIYGITSRAAFGKKFKEQEQFVQLVNEIVVLAGGFSAADLFPSIKLVSLMSGMQGKLDKFFQNSDRIMEEILNHHKSSRSSTDMDRNREEVEDLVDVLLKLQGEDTGFPLSDNSIKAVLFDIFSGGGETASTEINWAMAELIKNPRVMQKAQAEVRQVFAGKQNVIEEDIHKLKYLKLVIKETLRLHPSLALLVPRQNDERCEINGYEIPAKTKVIINGWAICRDPRYWIDGETFNPERFLDSNIDYKGTHFEYTPFGGGRRVCPGISFAVANIELQLAQLLFHFDWKLPNGTNLEDLDMSESFGITVRRKDDLCLVPIAYQNHNHILLGL